MTLRKIYAAALSLVIVSILISGCTSQTPSSHPEKRVEPEQQTIERKTDPPAYKAESRAEEPLNRIFIGTWTVNDSTAEFKISLKKGTISLSGIDLIDREHFLITNINWDKSTFQGTFTMPSTRHTTSVTLSILDENKLRCDYIGDASGESIWHRK